MKSAMIIRVGSFLLLPCVLAPLAFAAPVTLGVRAGSAIPNLHAGDDNPISAGWSSRLAPYFGIYADFSVTSSFSIEPEINYASQGGKRDGLQAITQAPAGAMLPPGQTLYANYKNDARFDYLEIPVLAKYRFGPLQRLFAVGGPFAGFLLTAKNVTSGSSEIFLDAQGTQPISPAYDFGATTDIKSDLHDFNWGVQAGLGISEPVGRGALSLDVRGEYGLMSIQKDTAANGKDNTGCLVIALGYSIPLGR